MTTPFEVGSRVVCLRPPAFIGAVVYIGDDGVLLVRGGAVFAEVGPDEVRPVMPRGPVDLDKYGEWWWCDAEVVRVTRADPVWASNGHALLSWRSGDEMEDTIDPADDWRGPVARPPEVRS